MRTLLMSLAVFTAMSALAFAQTTNPTNTNLPPAPMQSQNGGENVQEPGNPYAPTAARTPYATEQCAHQMLTGTPTGTVGSAGAASAAAPPGCN
jgi:hypothetical protein